MIGPFPGIDPYIEARSYWRDFHARFLSNLADALNAGLPPQYDAQIDERVSLIEEDIAEERRYDFLPDVAVTRSGERAQVETRPATAIAEDAFETIPLVLLERKPETYLKIVHRPDRALVTVIELLSPTNKGEGRRDYMLKRLDLLHQPVHLVELDFLVSGQRMPLARPWPKGDYHALVSRAEQRPDCQVYSWSVRQRVPNIQLPLRAPDPDIRLDLGAVLATTYERGRNPHLSDYTRDLGLSLSDGDCTWAEGLARAFAASAKGER